MDEGKRMEVMTKLVDSLEVDSPEEVTLDESEVRAICLTINGVVDKTKRIVELHDLRLAAETRRRVEAEHEASILRIETIGEGWLRFNVWNDAFTHGKGQIEDWPQTESGAYLTILEALGALNEACVCGDDDPTPLLYVRESGGAVACFSMGQLTVKEFTLGDMHSESIEGQNDAV